MSTRDLDLAGRIAALERRLEEYILEFAERLDWVELLAEQAIDRRKLKKALKARRKAGYEE